MPYLEDLSHQSELVSGCCSINQLLLLGSSLLAA